VAETAMATGATAAIAANAKLDLAAGASGTGSLIAALDIRVNVG
jgi:hypothetical protein